MTWRRFCVLLNGLSPESWWHRLQQRDPSKPKVIKGKAVDAYFASLGKG